MTAPVLNIHTLTPVSGTGKGKFTHNISKGKLPGSSRVWFSKEMEDPKTAYLEVLAQEFFRLIIPGQPETRIARDEKLNTYYILSEEVPGLTDLPVNQQAKFNNGTYSGLGRIVLTAVFVHEVDLKNGNIGLNSNNEVIKIDGDWSFVSIRDPKKCTVEQSKITPELLANLPYIPNFYAYHWLDIKREEISNINSKMVSHSLTNQSHFRREINQAMFRILLLPDSYIEKFVDAYIPVGSNADRFIRFLKERREELQLSALQNESFKTYLKSSEARKDAQAHFEHLKAFIANGTDHIVNESDYDALEKDYIERENLLLSLLKPKTASEEIPEEEQPKSPSIPTFSPIKKIDSSKKASHSATDKTWMGFLAGFIVAVELMTILLALRIIDIATLGLSFPLTIAATVGIVSFSGMVVGFVASAIQYLVSLILINEPQQSQSNAANNMGSTTEKQRHIRATDEGLTEKFEYQTQIISSILKPKDSPSHKENLEVSHKVELNTTNTDYRSTNMIH